MTNVYDDLKNRGLIAQSTDENALRKMLSEERITFYNGFDGTADSFHVGNLVPIMVMMRLKQAGHRVIGLVGSGTTMIGDPSGKTELRQMLSREEIDANATKLHAQLDYYLEFDNQEQAIAENNANWLLDLNYISFLRDIGRHFSVNRMLTAEAYRQRLDKGLNFIEFNYQIIQAYDFLELYRRYGCSLQTGGDDQWGNIVAGVDLVRRVEGITVHAMTFPLLTTASGTKMGKSAAGAIWLDAEKFSPFDYYQYWINCDDRDVDRWLKTFTFLPLAEIRRLAALVGAELREAKRVLAFEATKITHGEAEAIAAEAGAKAAFTGSGDAEAIPTTQLPVARLANGIGVLEIFAEVGLTSSRGEARRMLQQGGVYVNDNRVNAVDAQLTSADTVANSITLRAGKKKYHRLVFE